MLPEHFLFWYYFVFHFNKEKRSMFTICVSFLSPSRRQPKQHRRVQFCLWISPYCRQITFCQTRPLETNIRCLEHYLEVVFNRKIYMKYSVIYRILENDYLNNCTNCLKITWPREMGKSAWSNCRVVQHVFVMQFKQLNDNKMFQSIPLWSFFEKWRLPQLYRK